MADAVFGFKFDAYSAQFSSPGFMCPGYQAEETAKAIRWAAASAAASGEAPNVTIAIVPKNDTASHSAMMNTPGVHVSPRYVKAFNSPRTIPGLGKRLNQPAPNFPSASLQSTTQPIRTLTARASLRI